MNKKAVVIGASSGIGRELSLILLNEGFDIGVMARRTDRLDEIKSLNTERVISKFIDLADADTVSDTLGDLISELGGADLIVLSSGIGEVNNELDWSPEQNTIKVNVEGCTAALIAAYKYFESKGGGHLVGISSIAALRGGTESPAYNASKAFESLLMEGLRIKALKDKKNILITDIRPGFVDTPMAQGEGLFWVAPADKAAKQIYKAIKKKKKVAYITKRWRLVAAILKVTPDKIYSKF